MDEEVELDLSCKGSYRFRLLIFLFYLGFSFVLVASYPHRLIIFFPMVMTFLTLTFIDHYNVVRAVALQQKRDLHLYFLLDEAFWLLTWLLLVVVESMRFGLLGMTLCLALSVCCYLFFRKNIQAYFISSARIEWKDDRLQVFRKVEFSWD